MLNENIQANVKNFCLTFRATNMSDHKHVWLSPDSICLLVKVAKPRNIFFKYKMFHRDEWGNYLKPISL